MILFLISTPTRENNEYNIVRAGQNFEI